MLSTSCIFRLSIHFIQSVYIFASCRPQFFEILCCLWDNFLKNTNHFYVKKNVTHNITKFDKKFRFYSGPHDGFVKFPQFWFFVKWDGFKNNWQFLSIFNTDYHELLCSSTCILLQTSAHCVYSNASMSYSYYLAPGANRPYSFTRFIFFRIFSQKFTKFT